MIQERYKAQVDLLLRILPHVAREENLALKGGTAINLFIRNMPRLSVDIDLTYTRWQDDRATALQNIAAALDRITERLTVALKPISISRVPEGQGQDVKLNCQTPEAHVKIEVNTTTRGVLFPEKLLPVTDVVQKEFEKFAAIKVVAIEELYGGKICAALDRQHPRDLFDVYHLLKNEGITEQIKNGFLMFLLSHYRPMQELLQPHRLDQEATFELQFKGMTSDDFTYENYVQVREELIAGMKRSLTPNDKKFLLSFKQTTPAWELIKMDDLQHLPAVKWKLQNMQRLAATNPNKHTELIRGLEAALT
ncbi:nucleotidyl transferase AbiEii/AbiGii toxin family protein [Parachryseolinea silvisoli]|uniref:nucleotidyl transferase AbiEii/AbiGii toxin family protein n=1 Tax=Parachryseolinea silvisoli TaxID=2873601 RepID=UPI002265D945|nr:nucleotidyl transferase AbiEii/AbiGii toxin family protein [Parachryseolinea silvisoli]MCD9014438.1 nucleotidyl transferase AbiEii/AbiGii toxin family protein [Parachryseolinea silvisoli]